MAWLFHHIPSWNFRAPLELQMPRTWMLGGLVPTPFGKKICNRQNCVHCSSSPILRGEQQKILELPPTSFSFFWCPSWMKILKHWTQPSNFLRWKPNRTCRLTTCRFFWGAIVCKKCTQHLHNIETNSRYAKSWIALISKGHWNTFWHIHLRIDRPGHMFGDFVAV